MCRSGAKQKRPLFGTKQEPPMASSTLGLLLSGSLGKGSRQEGRSRPGCSAIGRRVCSAQVHWRPLPPSPSLAGLSEWAFPRFLPPRELVLLRDSDSTAGNAQAPPRRRGTLPSVPDGETRIGGCAGREKPGISITAEVEPMWGRKGCCMYSFMA